MPTKTKSTSAPAKKPVAKKTVVKTKTAVKKVEAKKSIAKKVTKKTSAKKPVAKKVMKAEVVAPVVKTVEITKDEVIASTPEITIKVEQPITPVVAMVKEEIEVQNKPVEVHRKIIYVGTCRNCDHMPMSTNKLVAVLSITIAVLSILLISATTPVHFGVPALSLNTMGTWLTSLVL